MRRQEALHAEMLALYQLAGRETGYWGHYYLRSVKTHGGLATAQRMLRPLRGKSVPLGLKNLIKAKRVDLSLEALVLRPEFRSLFTPMELREAANRMAAHPRTASPVPVSPEKNFPEEIARNRLYSEGGRKQITVNGYERDRRARQACLRHHGTRCKVCDLSFVERYGPRGKGFIHVHHRTKLASRRGRHVLNPARDLVPVCPNCHAMLHSQDPPLGVEELQRELSQPRPRR